MNVVAILPLLVSCGLSLKFTGKPPSPENVRVTCKNLTVQVQWEYWVPVTPHPTFRLKLFRNGEFNEATATENKYDLSHFVWDSTNVFNDTLWVEVSAVIAGHPSEMVISNTFSYNHLKAVDTRCLLDFPALETVREDQTMAVIFNNPFSYKEVKQLFDLKHPSENQVWFTVSSKKTHQETPCSVGEPTCKAKGLGDECVVLEGRFKSPGIEVKVKREKPICVTTLKNVNVTCKNLSVRVQWDYENPSVTTFRLKLFRDGESREVSTRELEYDLSRFVLNSLNFFNDYMWVEVTAVEDGLRSEAVLSKTFSYNQLKAVGVRCILDFPRVRWVSEEGKMFLMFNNPFAYKEVKQMADSQHPTNGQVSFIVSSKKSHWETLCSVEEPACRAEVGFPKDSEKCVTLEGKFTSPGKEVKVQRKEPICQSDDIEIIVLVTLLCAFAVLLSVVVLIICKVKAWTMKVPPHPKTLEFKPDSKWCAGDEAIISRVTIMKPPKTAPSGEKNHPPDPQDTDSVERSCYEKRGLLEEQEDDPCSPPGSYEKDCDSDTSACLYPGSVDMPMVSGYDSRPAVLVDMGDGETVTAYTES